MGLLVPLSPQGRQEVAGVEWYDSGIGFAVPLEQILEIVPRLRSEENLYAGIMGISLQDRDIYASKPVVAASRPNSPAYKAGIKAEDRIVAIDGEAIGRTAELFHALNRRYAGDTIRVRIARGEERLERELTLVDHLDPFQRPHLGILPLRDVGSAEAGVVVRYVYPESAAAKAGIAIGDRIVTVDDEPLAKRDELIARLNAASVGEPLRLEVMRGEDLSAFEVALGSEPEKTPAELPPSRVTSTQPLAPAAVDVGQLALKIAELANDCTAYVPTGYTPDRSYGLVVWLHPPGEFDAQSMLNRWRPACEREGLILVAPQAAAENRWQSSDLEFIRKIIEQVKSTYRIDDERVAAYGYQGGGTMAYLLAMSERELIHGVAAIDAPPTGAFAENDPVYRLTFYVTQSTRSRFARSIGVAVRQLRAMKYAVTTQNQGDLPRQPNEEEFAELLRWLDTLDKI